MLTFETLCNNMANELSSDKNILYEVSEQLAKVIISFNRLGFLTHTSQPGNEYNTIVYKSEWHRHHDSCPENILCTGIRKQRAYIRGYMKKELSEYVFNALKDDPYLFMRTSDHNREVPFNIKFGSVIFINDMPVLTQDNDTEESKNVPDASWSYNLSLPLRRHFTMMYPDVHDDNIVEVDIIDERWNDNTYLWTKVLDLLYSHT